MNFLEAKKEFDKIYFDIFIRKIMGDKDIKDPFEQRVERTWVSIDPKMTLLIKDAVGEEYYNKEMNKLKDFFYEQ